MVKRSGADHYVPVSWEEAYELIAQELNGLKSPDEAAFWTSGQCSNEAAFVYQLFARAYGTGPLHVARRHHAAGDTPQNFDFLWPVAGTHPTLSRSPLAA
jgi:anaerobic selenocysteine-containing dehydrogenase